MRIASSLCLLLNLVTSASAVAAPTDALLTGWWRISDRVEISGYEPFRGLRLEYRVRFRQEGAWIFGEGHKVAERGRPIPVSRQRPIAIVGAVAGSSVTASLVEHGHRRESRGEFSWTLNEDRTRMVGTFQSDAGRSRGSSVAERLSGP